MSRKFKFLPSWTEKVMLAMPGLFNVDNAL